MSSNQSGIISDTCECTSQKFWIGEKITASNIGAGKIVMMLGDKVKSMDEIIVEVAEFICSC